MIYSKRTPLKTSLKSVGSLTCQQRRHTTTLALCLLVAVLAITPHSALFGNALGIRRASALALGVQSNVEKNAERNDRAAGLYDENYRPQFHFTPARNWMNDPNGPIYYAGEYHLFYQYNPFGKEWGHMSWGHVVSSDLVHWKPLPLALSEANGVMIFSGSTVVDWRNSSGFCRNRGKETSPCLVAIYAGHSDHLETQNLAYSNDDGRTWTKYANNPVIDLHLAGFRDPKLFWHEGTHKWIMVTVLASEHKVRFFGSTDLKHWSTLSDFGPAGATAGAWECPDLFSLPVEGDAKQTRWVLSVNVARGGVAGGSGNQYFIGSFDGFTFTSENPTERVLLADYGADFYASTSFSDIPESDGRRIWLGWMTNLKYAAKIPTDPWRGVHSILREVKLRRFADGIRLVQEPITELRMLREQHTKVENRSIEAANSFLQHKKVHGETIEIAAEISAEDASEFGIRVRVGEGEETVIGVDPRKRTLFVDRTRSGNSSFDTSFPGRDGAPISISAGNTIKLHIFIDRSSVEVFGNDGEAVISEVIFPKRRSDGIELYSSNGRVRIKKMDVWKLQSAITEQQLKEGNNP
jgi:fructan beta-fructosidase